jgi:hypothetical protein
VNPDGTPHVIPVGCAKVLSDDEILVVDNFMKRTVENIKAKPQVAISAWDIKTFKGYEFKGDSTIETSGKVFDEGVNPKGSIVIKMKSIYVRTPGPDAGKEVT